MSTPVAIAAAVRAVARAIDERIARIDLAELAAVRTSALSPEQVEEGASGALEPKLNLFVYHVGLNAGWRNQYEPSRGSGGAPAASPLLALDLNILMSAHGGAPFLPEILLGAAMQALHDEPVYARERLRDLLKAPTAAPDKTLTAIEKAALGEQFELLRLTPLNLPPSEMQQLWTALHARYRPSFCYQASVVLIDSRLTAARGLPVRSVGSEVVPFVRPYVDRVDPPALAHDPAGPTVALVGEQLAQEGVAAAFSSGERVPLSDGSTASRALVKLPATLKAGLVGVRLVRRIAIGAAPPKEVNESNTAVFVHRPVFALAAGQPDIALSGAPGARTLAARVLPDPGPDQTIELLLNAPGNARPGLVLAGEPPAAAGAPVAFDVSAAAAGQWLVRVRVDGAETALTPDASGAYASPAVTL